MRATALDMPTTPADMGAGIDVGRALRWVRWCAIGLLVGGATLALGYTLAGHPVIRLLYEGATGTWLDGVLAGRDRHPLAHYYAVMDRHAVRESVALGLLGWGLLGASRASSAGVLVFLVATDVLFVLLECLYGFTAGFPASAWWLGQDWGYAETFQYGKEVGIVVVCFLFVLRYPHLLSLGWQLLFLYLVLDDAVHIHERVGRAAARAIQTAWVYTDHVASIVFGPLLLGVLGLGYYYAPRWLKRASRPLFGLFATLVLFGVVLDTAHQVIGGAAPLLFRFGYVVEEAGEMLALSVIAWYVHRLATRGFGTPPPNHPLPRGATARPREAVRTGPA